jgi:hypothetical protein
MAGMSHPAPVEVAYVNMGLFITPNTTQSMQP